MVESSPQKNRNEGSPSKLLRKAGALMFALSVMAEAEEEMKADSQPEKRPKFAPSTQALRRAVVQVYRSPAESDRQLAPE